MLPFADSRRLTGLNPFLASPGAALEVTGIEVDDRLIDGWRRRAARALAHLGWTPAGGAPLLCARRHATGASLTLAAPADQLYTATEVNEWALAATVVELDPSLSAGIEAELRDAASDDADPPVIAESASLARLARLAAREARPALTELIEAATAAGVSHMLDEEQLTLGRGAGSRSWPLDDLPKPEAQTWHGLRDIPTAVVTGSNGKTTTVRVIAACAREHGWVPGYSCTDGLFIAGEAAEPGDYSGPIGTRHVLRDPRVEAAALETARGGILRRGLAIERAHAAVVTNISSDHFGEYGVHDLDTLADVKLTVGALIHGDGLLVLNADDPLLRAKAPALRERFGRALPVAWFAQHADQPFLAEHRAVGGSTCGLRAGRLVLHWAGTESDLGGIDAMPLTAAGAAHFNVSNLSAAALASAALGVAPATIARAFARFGTQPTDNPGRLMRFERHGVTVLLDYAHNPASLRGILQVAQRLRGPGRIGMLLGHAGNRQDADFDQVADVVAGFRPDLVVVKEIEDYLRGRAPGEVPGLLRNALLRHGLPEPSVEIRMSELEAARLALDWARPGDVLVMLVHSLEARAAVLEMLRP
ncbi:MAG: Mur ligase family protein [Steroidobacteraceae bacterium]|jgi:UDP-N-acetylmuramyl tripeptide synthase|nr:Mur ligase family protein [Steroidobacteraceae bacterium]